MLPKLPLISLEMSKIQPFDEGHARKRGQESFAWRTFADYFSTHTQQRPIGEALRKQKMTG